MAFFTHHFDENYSCIIEKNCSCSKTACLRTVLPENCLPENCLPVNCLPGNCLPGNCFLFSKMRIQCWYLTFCTKWNEWSKLNQADNLKTACLRTACLETACLRTAFLFSKMRIQRWYLSFCTKWNEWSKLNQADNRFPISLLLSACTDDPNCQWWFYNKCIDVEIGEYP